MKKTYHILLIFSLVTTLFACKKNKDSQDVPDPNDIKGKWELAEYGTSWVPNKTYEPGNGTLLEIKSDTYTIYKDGVVLEQGNYSTEQDSSVEVNVMLLNLKDKYKTRIDFTNVTPSRLVLKTYFYVEDNKLYLIGGNYALDSGNRTVYRRSQAVAID